MNDRTFRTSGSLQVEPDLDLEACHTDPIHLTATIQPHGSFLQLDEEGQLIRSAAANAPDYFGRPAAELLGAPVEHLLGSDLPAHADLLRRDGGSRKEQFVTEVAGARLLVSVFPLGDDTVGLEVEPLPDHGALEELMVEGFPLLRRLRERTTRDELFGTVVRAVRSITGFDRVMLYRFDQEGHGSVVAEEARSDVTSYLGQRFPASDIPDPARRLYRKNRVRYIPAVDYEPVAILGPEGERSRGELDLTHSSLRGVPRVHRQYMRNMGVGSSCSFSVLVGGELWGLITCHSVQASGLEWFRREIGVQFAQATAQQIERFRAEDRDRRLQAVDGFKEELDSAADRHGLFSSLRANSGQFLSLLDAEGFYLQLGEDSLWIGSDGSKEPPGVLLEHIQTQLSGRRTAAVRSIVNEIDGSWNLSNRISGYFAVRLGPSPRHFCAWFRPEERETVEWGGDPRQPASVAEGGDLSPRASFEAWTQIVTDRCRAWTDRDRVTVRELSQVLEELIVEAQAQQLEQANQKLEELARTDDLTGLVNRRELFDRLAEELERADRYDTPLSVILLDLDHFKEINDRFGHRVGDRVLKRLGTLLREQIRAPDTAGRYGGEEFALILPGSDEGEATELAGRLLEAVRGMTWEAEGDQFGLTSSAGVAEFRGRADGPEGLLDRADGALYEAKERGRDQAVVA